MLGFKRTNNKAFNISDFFGVVSKLGEYLKVGIERAEAFDLDRERLAVFLTLKIHEWDPEVRGRKLFDADTRKACAAFIAGVACNYLGSEER